MNKKISYKYSSYEFGEFDIHLRTLKNKNQFLDLDDKAKNLGISSAQWSLFGVIWNSGIILAHEMLDINLNNRKILEVGCGIAMSSHLLNARGADITATDYHPEVEGFIKENIKLNESHNFQFILEDWDTNNSKLGTFDLIIGSDILYEVDHIELLSDFLNKHAKKICEIIIVDPNRGHINKFSNKMKDIGFQYKKKKSLFDKNFKGDIHQYKRE